MDGQPEIQQYIHCYESNSEEEDENSQSNFDLISGQYNKKTTQSSTDGKERY